MTTHGRYWDSWVNRNGPGDSRPTAIQIIKDENLEGKLKGKTVVITGASGGIGVETVRALHLAGATVFAIGRNEHKTEDAILDVQGSDPQNDAKIIPIIIDQESLDSVRAGAKQILVQSGGKINIIINNAGIMATPEGRTVDGYEKQLGVNHLSHFLLFQILKPALLAGSSSEFHSVSLRFPLH
jgi:NAD(P)-dependent dehydrogenase (short-subunit alcohol dehydrogenase family)